MPRHKNCFNCRQPGHRQAECTQPRRLAAAARPPPLPPPPPPPPLASTASQIYTGPVFHIAGNLSAGVLRRALSAAGPSMAKPSPGAGRHTKKNKARRAKKEEKRAQAQKKEAAEAAKAAAEAEKAQDEGAGGGVVVAGGDAGKDEAGGVAVGPLAGDMDLGGRGGLPDRTVGRVP